ncbi:MAG: LacI family DNA-binding transcriptional regulator [Armatimonadota bacterium]|nr:LacI family DNA-binding transcriptional regulator [Armatimonadota bacterium]
MTPTIRDVARKAGVSVATVSRVVNESAHKVREETRQRVLEAIQALGYQPNDVARGLKKRTSHTIGLIVPDISNPFYPAIARGIEDVANAHGYAIVLCNTYEDLAKEREYLSLLRRRWVDGLIFATSGVNTKHLQWLRGHRVPVVLVARDVEGLEIDAVLVDNFRGAYLAVQHLIGLGHRRIGFIGGPSTLHVSQERRRGYLQALDDAGIAPDPAYSVEGNFRAEGGDSAMQKLLQLSPPPTAVFAANDLMAIGAMNAIKRVGLRIPGDVAVVGFDDIPFASLVEPRLTTVAQPKYKMGAMAMTLLLERIEGKGDGPRKILLEPELIVRDSCGAREKEAEEIPAPPP